MYNHFNKFKEADGMRASQEFIKQLEELYQNYEQEVRGKTKEGLLTDSTARTYLLHSFR